MSLYDLIKPHIQNISVFRWIRFGIIFGLFFWVNFGIKIIIASRAAEKMMTVYSLATTMEQVNMTIDNIVYDAIADSFIFESILIICVAYYIYLKFAIWFSKEKIIKDEWKEIWKNL